MMLLQERLQLKTRDMERFGRQTHQAATPQFVPEVLPLLRSSARRSHVSTPAKDQQQPSAALEVTGGDFLPRAQSQNSDLKIRTEFDRLMMRYMGFCSTQPVLSEDLRRQKQLAIKEALKDIQSKHADITTSLRQFLDDKSRDASKITRPEGKSAALKKKTATVSHTALPAVQSATKQRAPQLSDSPFTASARPINNTWILPRKFSVLFNPERLQPSKATSRYSKINPTFMEGRSLQSPSVSVPVYPSISPNRMSDDNDAFAFVLDPRRRHKLIAKQTERFDRAQCASPWSPELKKSGVWDKNGFLDCNAFLFGEKYKHNVCSLSICLMLLRYIHFNRQTVQQMDLNEELKRKGVQKAEELLWSNSDSHRHMKRRAAASPNTKSPSP
jgi:hypothetical protein